MGCCLGRFLMPSFLPWVRPYTFHRTHIKDETEETIFGHVIILGAEGVGKTSIVNRLVYDDFKEPPFSTSAENIYEINALLKTSEQGLIKTTNKESTLDSESSDMDIKQTEVHEPLKSPKNKATLRKVVSTNLNQCKLDQQHDVGHDYIEGSANGLKRLKFSLVDTPSDLSEMEPTLYQSMLHNAAGFFLVCSFDNPDSLTYIDGILKDIGSTDHTPVVIIVNKSDKCEDDRMLDEDLVAKRAKESNIDFCCASMLSKDGYEEMAELLLNTINAFAEKGEQEDATPEDYAYFTETNEYQ